MTDAPSLPVLSLTPLDPAFREDPYTVLDGLRSRCPVMRDPDAGVFFLTAYDDVRGVLTDLSLWRDPNRAEPAAVLTRRMVEDLPGSDAAAQNLPILLLDDPHHARIRPPLAKALYKRAARFKPQVEAIVDATLDAIDPSDPFDLMSTFALPIPIDVIAAILGVSHDRLEEFRAWSEGAIQGLNPLRTAEQTALMQRSDAALEAHMAEMIVERRARPRDDLVSDMARLQAEGADLTDQELITNLNALLIAGNLTTTDLIGNAVRLLLTHPRELAKLRADPGRIGQAVEEVLRFEPPVDITGRIASHDMAVGGRPIAARQSMLLSLRGANRDPSAFDNPNRFDITRKKTPHVAFGGGAHICIGAPLARLEAQVALTRLLDRFPDLRLAGDGTTPQWRTLPFFRGLETLPVAAGPAPGQEETHAQD